ncbi:hypothetical protein D3C72_1202990 [compost metagenome]
MLQPAVGITRFIAVFGIGRVHPHRAGERTRVVQQNRIADADADTVVLDAPFKTQIFDCVILGFGVVVIAIHLDRQTVGADGHADFAHDVFHVVGIERHRSGEFDLFAQRREAVGAHIDQGLHPGTQVGDAARQTERVARGRQDQFSCAIRAAGQIQAGCELHAGHGPHQIQLALKRGLFQRTLFCERAGQGVQTPLGVADIAFDPDIGNEALNHGHHHQAIGERLVLHQRERQRIALVAVQLRDLVDLLDQFAQADFLARQRTEYRGNLVERNAVHAAYIKVQRHDALRQPGLQGQLFGRDGLHNGRRLRGAGRPFKLRQGVNRVAPQRAIRPRLGAKGKDANKGEGKRTCRVRTSHCLGVSVSADAVPMNIRYCRYIEYIKGHSIGKRALVRRG